MTTLQVKSLGALTAAILLVFVPMASADTLYTITVNTSSVSLANGYIDFQFNPGSSPTQMAEADVMGLLTDGVLNPSDPLNSCCSPSTPVIGDVSGQLPGDVSLINFDTTNEYTEAMTFGDTISFQLLLSGPALGGTANGEGGGTFALDFLNADQSGYLFTSDPLNDVPVFTVNINPDGSTTGAVYPSSNDGAPVVTFSGPTTVPEPSSFVFMLTALTFPIVGRLVRRRGRSNSFVS